MIPEGACQLKREKIHMILSCYFTTKLKDGGQVMPCETWRHWQSSHHLALRHDHHRLLSLQRGYDRSDDVLWSAIPELQEACWLAALYSPHSFLHPTVRLSAERVAGCRMCRILYPPGLPDTGWHMSAWVARGQQQAVDIGWPVCCTSRGTGTGSGRRHVARSWSARSWALHSYHCHTLPKKVPASDGLFMPSRKAACHGQQC